MSVKHCKCIYVIANMRGEGPQGFFCSNDHSPKFGQKAVGGCEMCQQSRRKMTFKEAFEMLLMLPEGASTLHLYRYGNEDELINPVAGVTFKDNVQMHDYMSAQLRCFEELMRIKEEAGDFDEDVESGQAEKEKENGRDH